MSAEQKPSWSGHPQEPELPDFTAPYQGASGICGSTYYINKEVRAPYGSVSRYEPVLKPIAPQNDWENPETLAAVYETIDRVEALLAGKDPELPFILRKKAGGAAGGKITVVDPKNYAAIQNILGRARGAADKALSVWDWWAEGVRYGGEEGIPTSRWPLFVSMTEAIPDCDDINVANCPTSEDWDDHQVDEESYRELVKAAMFWARCAEETATAVAVYHLNKGTGKKMAPKTPKTRVPGAGTFKPPAVTDPGIGEGEPDEGDTATVKKGKVKLGRPVKIFLGIVGVAAVGGIGYGIYRSRTKKRSSNTGGKKGAIKSRLLEGYGG